MFQIKFGEKIKTRAMLSNVFFPENHVLYEIM